MRKTLNEPGFWMMVFGVVVIAMILFAGEGNCAERQPGVQYIVKAQRIHSGWEAGIGAGGGVGANPWPSISISETAEKVVYHHYIKAEGQRAVFVFTTDYPPSMFTFVQALRHFEVRGGK